MKKKLLLGIMALAMSLCLTPALAFASTYTVYVGGVAMTADSDGKSSYYTNGATSAKTTEPASYNAKLWYDTANNVLTLDINNLDVTGIEGDTSSNGAGIYSSNPLTLVLSGDSDVSGAKSGSDAYGIRVAGLTVTTINQNNAPTLTVHTDDDTRCAYGIYSSNALKILNATLDIESGNSTKESYGIYAKEVTIGSASSSPQINILAGDSKAESCGIYGHNGITVENGNINSAAGYASGGYADGMLANNATITINGGIVNSSSERSYGGMATGICANALKITGGTVTATGGFTKLGEQQSAGIYTNYDIEISGGKVTGEGREAFGDVSFGINSWRGNITIGGESEVHAIGGPASYSVGLCCERRDYQGNKTGGDITIKDNAKVYTSTDDSNTIRVYSYGTFVGGNLLIEGTPYLESIAGRVSQDIINGLSNREKRSFGIYIADDVYDSPDSTNYVENGYTDTKETHTICITGGTVIAKTLDKDNGVLPMTESKTMNRSYAVVLYDAPLINFSNTNQPNNQWYEWKIGANDSFTRSTDKAYPYANDWQSPTQYFHVQPISNEENPSKPNPDESITPNPENPDSSQPESPKDDQPTEDASLNKNTTPKTSDKTFGIVTALSLIAIACAVVALRAKHYI